MIRVFIIVIAESLIHFGQHLVNVSPQPLFILIKALLLTTLIWTLFFFAERKELGEDLGWISVGTGYAILFVIILAIGMLTSEIELFQRIHSLFLGIFVQSVIDTGLIVIILYFLLVKRSKNTIEFPILFWKGLNLKITAILFVFLLMITVSVMTSLWEIMRQKGDVFLINLAARQRMLAVKIIQDRLLQYMMVSFDESISLTLDEKSSFPPTPEAPELVVTGEPIDNPKFLFQQTARAMLDGGEITPDMFSYNMSNEIRKTISPLSDEESRGFLLEALKKLETVEKFMKNFSPRFTEEEQRFAADIILEEGISIVRSLDRLVRRMQELSERKVTYFNSVQKLTSIASIVTFVLLVVLAREKVVSPLNSMTQSLRESEERYRTVIECSPGYIFLLDMDGKVLDINLSKGKEKLTTLSTNHVYDNIHPDYQEEFKKNIKDCFQESGLHEFEVRSSNKRFMYQVMLGPVETSQGIADYIVCNMYDITKRRKLESQLVQAQKLEAIGQLAAGIAHEINTPSQYISDNVRFLKESFAEILPLVEKYRDLLETGKQGPLQQELLDEVNEYENDVDIEYLVEEIPAAISQSLEGLERVTQIVAAMKEFSHPGVEKKVLLDINKAIKSTIMISRNEWKYVADMVTDYDSNLPPVLCLPGELNQVILNLIINAADAIAGVVGDGSKGKGVIDIRTHKNGEWAEIYISDTGAGIAEKVRPKIFDPFFTTKEVGKGTGQGLAISHDVVVEKHGGTITFETEEGKGTTFEIRLPL